MYRYEISKHMKDSMSEDYFYTDWLSIYDIGREFEDGVLTAEEYWRVETNYIRAIYLILKLHGIEELEIRSVRRGSYKEFLLSREKHKEFYTKEIMSAYDRAPLMEKVGFSDIGSICRLMLREDIGCRLFYPRRLRIGIGYDFLMQISSSRPLDKIVPAILDLGLGIDKEIPEGIFVWEPDRRDGYLWATWEDFYTNISGRKPKKFRKE